MALQWIDSLHAVKEKSADKCCNLYEIVAMLVNECYCGQMLKPKLKGCVRLQVHILACTQAVRK